MFCFVLRAVSVVERLVVDIFEFTTSCQIRIQASSLRENPEELGCCGILWESESKTEKQMSRIQGMKAILFGALLAKAQLTIALSFYGASSQHLFTLSCQLIFFISYDELHAIHELSGPTSADYVTSLSR